MKNCLLLAALLGIFGLAPLAEAQTLLKAGIQIKNTSDVTISYQFRWRDLPHGDWVAQPGETRYFWITFYSNTPRPQASIRFDRIPDNGVLTLSEQGLVAYEVTDISGSFPYRFYRSGDNSLHLIPQ